MRSSIRSGKRLGWRPTVAVVASSALLATGAVAVTQSSASAFGHGGPAFGCDARLVGWAATPGDGLMTTTGGGWQRPTTVTTLAELQALASDPAPQVVRVSGTISTGTRPVEITSNKTIVGADRNARIEGGLNISTGASNIIVRNLTVKGAGFGNAPVDAVASRGSHHLWFDHLDLSDAGDGLLDLTKGSDYITVSWTKFSYTEAHAHRFASLISGGSTHDETDVGKENATFVGNWFAELVDQRMPRLLFGRSHVYNNYYTSTGNTYVVGVGSLASVLIENNYFKDVNNPHQFMYDRPHYIVAKGNIYDNTTGSRAEGAGGIGGGIEPFTTPPYRYHAMPAAAVPYVVPRCAGPVLHPKRRD